MAFDNLGIILLFRVWVGGNESPDCKQLWQASLSLLGDYMILRTKAFTGQALILMVGWGVGLRETNWACLMVFTDWLPARGACVTIAMYTTAS